MGISKEWRWMKPLTITATDSGMSGTNTRVYQAYFECPDAAASSPTATPAAFLLFVD